MIIFCVLMGVAGLASGFFLSWIIVFISSVAVFTAALLSVWVSGQTLGGAALVALAGTLALQAGFVTTGFGTAVWRSRAGGEKLRRTGRGV
ncbi:hypothetical protein ABEG18_05285 [Alsobacter sp. KACC 23698]|uniref:Uncharacterized protein n=1 Tax=Alsobacter sp. KACC 23698 TaxID=3149229 RepID=A0AAU7JJ04_9HYPH